jgi:outer membrane protein OmpA-like peptidoglycan-associated protein
MKLVQRCGIAATVLLLAACGQAPVRTTGQADAVSPVAQEEKALPPVADKPSEAQIMAQVNLDNSVFFPAGGTELDAASLKRLAALAERLKAMEEGIVTLHGYTDHLGSPSYNLAIAEQRVNAVAMALRRNGIAATQIRRNAVGSERVPAACRSVQCRRLMRRVELVFGE